MVVIRRLQQRFERLPSTHEISLDSTRRNMGVFLNMAAMMITGLSLKISMPSINSRRRCNLLETVEDPLHDVRMRRDKAEKM